MSFSMSFQHCFCLGYMMRVLFHPTHICVCVYVYFVCVYGICLDTNHQSWDCIVVALFLFFCLATNNTQLQEEQKISFFVCCFQSFLCLFERRKKKILYFIYKRARKSIAHMKINKLFHNFSSFFFFVFLLLPFVGYFFSFFGGYFLPYTQSNPSSPFLIPHCE